MRTAFQGWHVPRGYRIVWSDRPPAGRPEVTLIPAQSGAAPPSDVPGSSSAPALGFESAPVAVARPEEADAAEVPVEPSPAPPPPTEPPEPEPGASVEPVAGDGDDPPAPASAPAGGSPGGRLPIQDVLAHLYAQEAAGRALDAPEAPADAPPPAPPPSPARAPAPKRRSTWDFMDDEPIEDDPVPGPGRIRAPESTPSAAASPADREVEPVSRRAGGLPAWWRSVRPAMHNFFSGPAEPRPMLVIGLAMTVAIGVAFGLYWAGYPAPGSRSDPPAVSAPAAGESEGSETGEKPDPFAPSAPFVSPRQAEGPERQQALSREASDQVAYVAASLLICRDAPLQEARRVRNLLRGREVRVLGYDGPWASLAYGGGQCWAQAQYLSPVPPI
ncbi:MAG TPA: hypothetical protein VF650_00895 [Allosphingosinicella sp.]